MHDTSREWRPFIEFTPYERWRFVCSAFVIAIGLSMCGVSFMALAPLSPHLGVAGGPVIGSALVLIGAIWGWRDPATRPSIHFQTRCACGRWMRTDATVCPRCGRPVPQEDE